MKYCLIFSEEIFKTIADTVMIGALRANVVHFETSGKFILGFLAFSVVYSKLQRYVAQHNPDNIVI